MDGALCDSQLYISTQWRDNLSQLPTLTQKLFRRLVADKEFESPAFKAIEASLAAQYTTRWTNIYCLSVVWE